MQSSSICWVSTWCCFAKRTFSSAQQNCELWWVAWLHFHHMKQLEAVTSSWKQVKRMKYIIYTCYIYLTWTGMKSEQPRFSSRATSFSKELSSSWHFAAWAYRNKWPLSQNLGCLQQNFLTKWWGSCDSLEWYSWINTWHKKKKKKQLWQTPHWNHWKP